MLHRLGFDFGSATIKLVLIDEHGVVCYRAAAPYAGSPYAALRGLIEPLNHGERRGVSVSLALSGRSRALGVERLPACTEVSDIVAAVVGAQHCHPSARDVVSFGAEYSLWCRLDPARPRSFTDFALSDLCAAGAGSFLEQQSGRLGMSVEGLARAAVAATRAPTVAGRCAVFTKSDLIHLQQKGAPIEEIALGLCHALVRTFQAQVMHGRLPELPLLFMGGCAKNQGMVRAAREVFALGGDDLLVADWPEFVAATGTALLAEAAPIVLDELCSALRDAGERITSWPTLSHPSAPVQVAPADEPRGDGLRAEEVILGVDVGSVSTNLALVDTGGRLLDSVYVYTSGKPLDAVREALTILAQRHSHPIHVVGAGATGSGRYLADYLIGADLVKNEIAAQLRAAVAVLPDVDTVLEIGGQDAKYIRAEQGTLRDFAMNRLCAAGTGSFLAEQAEKLGIRIVDEFAARALAAKAPIDLGCRCTVFMESAAVAALAAGASLDDVAAGLALSVARNYLDRVVQGRSIGQHVLFQGGTAANLAVVAAFERLLGRPVRVHPHHRVSGAFGIALLVLDQINQSPHASPRGTRSSRFRGLSPSPGTLERIFECPQCTAHCQVTRLRADDRVFHFGDACERYTAQSSGSAMVDDPLSRRTELLLRACGLGDPPDPSVPRALGIPRAAHCVAVLPWLTAIARAAGRSPVLSGPTTPQTLADGMRHLTSDSCLPVKAAYGHVAELTRWGMHQVLMPSVGAYRGDEELAHNCLLCHHLPWMVAGAVPGAEIIAPELSLDLPKGRRVDDLAEAASALGLSRDDVERALDEGDTADKRWRQELRAWGREVLAAGHDRIAVVFGRPYLLSDPLLSLSIGRHLARLGLAVLPFDALPIESVVLDGRWQDLPWHHPRDLIRAGLLIEKDARLFPVVVTSFGCGPDAFTVKHLEQLFAGRPHLFVELDEHRSEAGLMTRLEAFSDEIAAHLSRRQATFPRKSVSRPRIDRRHKVVMPYFGDYAHGQAGILRAAGYDVTLLPPPGRGTRERGEAVVSGRECYPFTVIAGDLAACVESGAVGPDTVFFLPGTVVSCLLRQYGDGLDLMLQRLGAGGVRLMTASLESWPRLVGLPLTVRLGATLAGTDMLLRARCRLRPYELQAGRADAIYQRSLEHLSVAAERGTLWDTLRDCAAEFHAIEIHRSERPLVGVVGDVYTRASDFASEDLFRRLEDAGCEVWPAPFIGDVVEYNATRRRQLAWRLRRPHWHIRYGLTARVLTRQRQRVEALFSGIEGIKPEISAEEMQTLVRPHVGSAANPLLLLNLGRMIHYARTGADGIVNASCINCMVGSASHAFEERLRHDGGQIPITSLVYGGSHATTNQIRLEAFLHQVRRAHAERMSSRSSAKG